MYIARPTLGRFPPISWAISMVFKGLLSVKANVQIPALEKFQANDRYTAKSGS
jgi:hypothetical protein